MDRVLIVFLGVLCFCVGVLFVPEGITAICVAVIFGGLTLWILNRDKESYAFLFSVFLLALLLRMSVASLIYGFDLQIFFGPDSGSYDLFGYSLRQQWLGEQVTMDAGRRYSMTEGVGWGMSRLVAAIYLVVGRNQLAAQFLSCVAGAATVPAIYHCAFRIYGNLKVARITAVIVAVCPSLIIWSSQLLKDGFIIFLLVMATLATLELHRRISVLHLSTLLSSLFGILSLRFYVLYIVATAVIGSIFVTAKRSPKVIIAQFSILLVLAIGFSFLGLWQKAQLDLTNFANLDRIQVSRTGLAQTAESGFGKDIDVSTTSGALTAMPTGFLYLMLAPFPWQITNLRQAITLPEMILWWGSLPLLLIGLWYTIRYRLTAAVVVLTFTLMLSAAYSIYLSNVGVAYRQRAQIQVFLFIFVSVGWTVLQERRNDKKQIARIRK